MDTRIFIDGIDLLNTLKSIYIIDNFSFVCTYSDMLAYQESIYRDYGRIDVLASLGLLADCEYTWYIEQLDNSLKAWTRHYNYMRTCRRFNR